MKQVRQSITQAFIAGVLFVLPVYLAILLLLKAAKSLGDVVKPLTSARRSLTVTARATSCGRMTII